MFSFSKQINFGINLVGAKWDLNSSIYTVNNHLKNYNEENISADGDTYPT